LVKIYAIVSAGFLPEIATRIQRVAEEKADIEYES
jgi:hypothetical protein